MKLLPAIALSAVLALGTAACGDDNDNGGGSGGSGGSSSDSGGGSGNADVQAYCDAVKDYVAKVNDAVKSKDYSKLSDLQAESQDLTDKATALSSANLSSDDAQEVADCTKQATDALNDLSQVGQ